ncbi:MAG: hypothetical protein ACE5F7_05005 [Nitrospiria bacterium]
MMLTWIKLWPAFALPMVFINLSGFLPTIFEAGRHWGGGPVRQWLSNKLLIPLLSDSQAEQLVQWFHQASVVQECLMYSIIVLNLNVLALPFLYLIGEGIMKGLNGISVRELELKRQAAR